MRLLFLGFSSPVAGLEATVRKVAHERLEAEVGICGEKFPVDGPGLGEGLRGQNRGLLPIPPPFEPSGIRQKR